MRFTVIHRFKRLLCLGVMLAFSAVCSKAETLELHNALIYATVDGKTTEQSSSLPYHWDRHHPGLAGVATFHLSFALSSVPAIPYGLYIPRLGNAYEVWLNGALIQRNGDMNRAGGADFAKGPRHIVITPMLLGLQNVLHIVVRADVGRRAGLAPMVLGPYEETYPLYLSDYRTRSTGTFGVVLLSCLIGLIAMVLWMTQVERIFYTTHLQHTVRDRLYLFAGIAELCWTIRVCDAILETPPLVWPWWGVVTVLSLAAWVASMMLFCVELANWSHLPATAWLRRWLWLEVTGTAAAASIALFFGYPLVLTVAYATLGVTALVFLAFYIWKAVHGGLFLHKIVAGTLLLNTMVGLRDWYMFRVSEAFGGNTWMRYSSILFALTLGYVVILRFRDASGHARDLLVNLESRVAEKESELKATYDHVEKMAREQERGFERSRILRDMHDGVGSHISVAMRQLQSGKATDGQVLQTLRESLDHLKLSIDAMNAPNGDITVLLANMRYRLEPRLKAADVLLLWDVDLIEPLERLDSNAMRQLQFMVYEALSNVLQHSHAKTVRIELAQAPHGVRLRVVDDGCGFDVSTAPHKGLAALRTRAIAVGGTVHIHSEPGNTVFEILLV